MGALVPTFFQFHQFSIRNTKSAIHCLVIPMADRTFSLGLNAIKKKRIGLVGLLPKSISRFDKLSMNEKVT